MKKILLLATLVLPLITFSQLWEQNLSQEKLKSNEITFFELQKAFDDYWADYKVDNKGYYVNENGIKKKAAGWKQFNRWAWNMEGQINPSTGKFPTKTAQQVYNEYKKTIPKQGKTKTASWTSFGPESSRGGYAGVGRLNCIAFHPTDNNTYWVGAPSGGLWVTTNNAVTWTCLTDDNSVIGISDIIIPSDYETSTTIYIASGDRDGLDNNSVGVLKSIDGGITWNTTGLDYSIGDGKLVNRLLLDPNDDNTIIAATSNGVFKTTNGGTDWSTQLSNYNFIDMEYKPTDYSTLYGCNKSGGVYLSVDNGENWTKTLSNSGGNRVELAITNHNPNILYAVIANSDGGLLSVQKSSNSGSDFTEVLKGSTKNLLGWYSNGSDDGGQGWYDLSIASSPTDSNIVLIGGINSHISTDGGDTWSCSNCWTGGTNYNSGGHPIVHADKHNLNFRSNGDLFECNDGGVYVSSDNGSTWIDKTDGMIISQIYKLSVSQTHSNEVINGLQDNGTKLYSNQTWYDVKGGDGMECIIDYTDKDIQYGSYVYGQISRTTNHWYTATNIEPANAGDGAWVTPYIIDPADNNTLYAGYSNVWKTTNQGDSWTLISSMNSSIKLRSMAISHSNTSTLYVADTRRIWKTTNGGDSWSEITGTLPVNGSNITYITIKNDDENTLWVALSGYNSNSIYESIDGGNSWYNISDGLPQLPAYSIVQDIQVSSEPYLYVGTELGIYFKKGSENWIEYNTGLPNVKIGELEIYYDKTNSSNSKLRAATYGRGLWESSLITAPPVAEFSTQLTTNNVGETQLFTDLSMNSPTEWKWSFEQGSPTTSTEQNPKVIYNATGTYDVTLIVTNYLGSDTLTKADYITIKPVGTPSVGFTSDKNSIFTNKEIQFTDTTLYNPTNWEWVFTGGTPSTSTEQNPIISYMNTGDFDVTLKSINSIGNTSITKTGYISVTDWPTPEAYFDAAPISGIDPLEVTFTDTSKNAVTWSWNFGDEQTSTEQNPTHTFTKGTYTISLFVTNPSGDSFLAKNNLIIVDPNSLQEDIKHKLKVYPNPVSDILSIEFVNENNNNVNIELFDINGKLVKRVIPNSNTQIKQDINIDYLDAGSYILKVKIGDDILVLNIIKE